MNDLIHFLDTIVCEADAGRGVALCVVVATRGSTPKVPGSMACVTESGEIIGTVGGGMTEADVMRHAGQLLCSGQRHCEHRTHFNTEESARAEARGSRHNDDGLRGQAKRRHVDHDENARAYGWCMAPDRWNDPKQRIRRLL